MDNPNTEHMNLSRKLLRQCRSGSLGTQFDTAGEGAYVSLVTYATDLAGAPIFLFSDLSDHTQNLLKNPCASFLVEKASHLSQPQAGPRLTLMGTIKKTKSSSHISRFLCRHPKAKIYAHFSDFNYYIMEVKKAHLIGGFAISKWLKGSDLISSSSLLANLLDSVGSIVEHMNTDHRDTINLYAQKICKRKGSEWKVVQVDCDGIDLMCAGRHARVDFKRRVYESSDVKKELIDLAHEAKKL